MDRIPGLRCTYVFLFSFTLSHAANNWKYLNHEISREKKNWTHKIFAKKKSRIHEISPTKIFVSTKYLREKFGLEISCFKRFVTKNINLFISWLLPLKLPDQELRDHLFSTYIKFSEKITSYPGYTYVLVSGVKNVKFCLCNNKMIPHVPS